MKNMDTKSRLLEATLLLVSEKGYLGAATREIAGRAGVTEITLFRHFGSKEHLFEEVLRKYSFLPELKSIIADLDALSFEDALMLVGERYLHGLIKRRSLIKIMLSEINLYPEKVRAAYNSLIGEVRLTLAEFLEARRKAEGGVSSIAAARAFLGMVFSYFLAEGIVKGKNITKKEARNTLAEIVRIFLGGVTDATPPHSRRQQWKHLREK
jgi:AcrR family transcriptional regulator